MKNYCKPAAKGTVFLAAAVLCLTLSACSGKKGEPETMSESEALELVESLENSVREEIESAAGVDLSGVTDETPAAEEEAVPEDENTSVIPEGVHIVVPFMYSGEDPYMSAVCMWMEEESEKDYEPAEVMIPAPVIVYTDESDSENIRIWGNFWIFNYTLEDGNLVCESGGSYPGVLYLQKIEDGYEVVDSRIALDSSDDDAELKEICASAPEEAGDLYEKFTAADMDEIRVSVREEYIRMYAEEVPYAVTSYQDYGWDPVVLD